MPGPTPWTQIPLTINTSTQSITTTTETVVATLTGINSRGPAFPISLLGMVYCAVQAATTSTTLRIRSGTVTGTVIGAPVILAATAASLSSTDISIAATDTPTGEYAGQTYVLTVQAAAAAANWNVLLAELRAFI